MKARVKKAAGPGNSEKSGPAAKAAPRSSSQRVYALLRERILNLELAPNAELDEVQISREMGFSRTPVREALIKLASDGLVVLAPNRGARVAPLDFDQVPQVLEALELYERATTRWAAHRRQPHHLALLEQRSQEFIAATETKNPRLVVEANWAFHEAINQASGNEYLAADCSKMLRGVMRLSLLAFHQTDPDLTNYANVAAQHEQMIAAIRDGDADRAEALVFEHSDEFRERMATFVAGSTTAGISLTGHG